MHVQGVGGPHLKRTSFGDVKPGLMCQLELMTAHCGSCS